MRKTQQLQSQVEIPSHPPTLLEIGHPNECVKSDETKKEGEGEGYTRKRWKK